MKGKIETVVQAGTAQPEMSRNFTYLYMYGIKRAFIDALRASFADENMPIEFRYNDDSNKSQISIYRNYPSRVEKLPFIVVQSGSGDASLDFLGDQLESQGDEEIVNGKAYCYVYGGKLTLDMTISLATATIRDLENLTDLTMCFMRIVFIDLFRDMNLAYNKINIAGEEVEEAEDQKYYKNVISTTITADFSALLPKDLLEMIERIKLKIGTYTS